MNSVKYLRKAAFIAFMISIFSTVASAGIVGATTAQKEAEQQLEKLNKQSLYTIISYKIINRNGSETPLYYVFNLKPQGFILISANSELSPVIGYAFENDYIRKTKPAEDNPDFCIIDLTELRLNYSKNIANQIESPGGKKFDNALDNETITQWPKEGATTTGGWLKENWGKNAPYNQYCPKDFLSEIRSPAGGPALAMAQILNYYKCINKTRFSQSDSYQNNYSDEFTFYIDEDYEAYSFPNFSQLNAYLDKLEAKYKNKADIDDNDKAALIFACGVKAKQSYGENDINCMINAEQIFDAYNKFSCTKTEHFNTYYKKLYMDLEESMKNANPAHIVFRSKDNEKGCHAVIDGYNSDGFFHINFGNAGDMNGWYQMQNNMPEDYALIQGSLLNINQAPQDVNEPALETANRLTCYPNPFNDFTVINLQGGRSGNEVISIYDATGNLVKSFSKNDFHGNNSIIWDGADNSGRKLSAGAYFIRLLVDNKQTSLGKAVIAD